MNSKERVKGWTKITEMIFLNKEEKHICEEEKSHFGETEPFFFQERL